MIAATPQTLIVVLVAWSARGFYPALAIGYRGAL
jgi:hypothetical protein